MHLSLQTIKNVFFFRRASLFVKVMNKPSRSDLVRIKVKALFKLEVCCYCWV